MHRNDSSVDEDKTLFNSFLESKCGSNYIARLRSSFGTKPFRMLVDLNDIRKFDANLVSRLLRRPSSFITSWTEVAASKIQPVAVESAASAATPQIYIGFTGAFGAHQLSPRDLRSTHLGTLVCVEGVVTRCSVSQTKIVRSVHWSAATGQLTSREHPDVTGFDIDCVSTNHDRRLGQSSSELDEALHEIEYGLSVYKDHQILTIQEAPECAPLGQLPRSVDVFIENDLVDSVKPGDRVRCAGVYRALIHNLLVFPRVSRTAVLANSLTKRASEDVTLSLNLGDIENIKAIALGLERSSGFGSTLSALSVAFAPSIHGHDIIKRALVLQLARCSVGGTEKVLINGSRLRGDINVLLVGDPSTAKSQLLRAAMRLAPLAVSTTGRGSSGVGLTAAVVNDQETGDRRLEAGATVLADRGMVCIDEFDKMSTGDRVAIHEVMEQQTVTLAKAGVHASLNARCAVLAAANPVYGHYDTDRRPQDNIGLCTYLSLQLYFVTQLMYRPDSLLSRFDLLFILLDTIDNESDRRVADHVLHSHQFRSDSGAGRVKTGTAITMESNFQPASQAPFNDTTSHSRHPTHQAPPDEPAQSFAEDAALNPGFVRRFIYFARHLTTPVLNESACQSIASAYADLRAKADERTLPVTARCLESLVRLSTAHAKVRLSRTIDERDCATALELLSRHAAFAMYGVSRRNHLQPEPGCDSSSTLNDMKATGFKRSCPADPGQRTQKAHKATGNPERSNFVIQIFAGLQSAHGENARLSITELANRTNSSLPEDSPPFDIPEIELILRNQQNENRLMYDETNGTIT